MTIRKCRLLPVKILPAAFLGFISCISAAIDATAAEKSGFAPVLIEKVSIARQLDLLQTICEQGQVAMHDGVPVCSTCPSFTSGGKTDLRITNSIRGSFTNRGATEILVDVAGCEPETANGGGSVLLEAGERGWTRILYLAGFRSSECVRFRSTRQTASLACNMSRIDHGIQHGNLKLLSLRSSKPVQHLLFEWYDNSRSNPQHLTSVFPYRFVKADFNADGRVDLQVNVRVRDEAVPQKYTGFIDAMARGHRFQKEESLRLVYLFDGNMMTLSPDTEENKASIDGLLEKIRNK